MRLKPTHTYEVIACALLETRPLAVLGPAHVQWERDVRALASALRADNRYFKQDLFFKQCGF